MSKSQTFEQEKKADKGVTYTRGINNSWLRNH